MQSLAQETESSSSFWWAAESVKPCSLLCLQQKILLVCISFFFKHRCDWASRQCRHTWCCSETGRQVFLRWSGVIVKTLGVD
jgi:hypothetical protein